MSETPSDYDRNKDSGSLAKQHSTHGWAGLLLAVNWLSVVAVDTDSMVFVSYLLGSVFAHATLAAAWTIFGPGGNMAWRAVASTIWIVTLPVAVAINISFHGGPRNIPFILGGCLLGQWVLLLLVFGGLVVGFSLRLGQASQIGDADHSAIRFGIRHLLIVMAVVSAVLGLGRAIVPRLFSEGGANDGPIMVFLATAAIIITLPVLLATFMRRWAVLGVALSLLLVAGATMSELPIMESLGGEGPEQGHFIAINATSTLLVLLVAGITRINGYFLLAGREPQQV